MPDNSKGPRAVIRAMSILEYLAHSDGPKSLAQISVALGVNKASVHRTLHALIEAGYVYREERPVYQLSFKICELSSYILNRLDLRYIARPHLERLNQETGETVHLVIRDWSQGVYIDKIESTHGIRVRSSIGERIYLHSTAAGKVLLANLPWFRVEQIVAGAGLPARTSNTLTSQERLRLELEQVASQGWAVDREENEEGIQCLAAPLMNYRQNVVAAVSISYPSLSGHDERFEDLRSQVCKAARQISERLGYIPASTTEVW